MPLFTNALEEAIEKVRAAMEGLSPKDLNENYSNPNNSNDQPGSNPVLNLLEERDAILNTPFPPNDPGAAAERQEALDEINERIGQIDPKQVIEVKNDLRSQLDGLDADDPARAEILAQMYELNEYIPYGSTQQLSSHNSYDTDDHDSSITDQFNEDGIHSFELDIHSGDPDRFGEWGKDEQLDEDYYVYHNSWDQGTRIESFSDGLQEIEALENREPITLFVDLKGNPLEADGLSRDVFEGLVQDKLGDKLYTPQDWINSVPGATTLDEAFELGGWPTLANLDGRVMVVLTGGGMDGQLGDYVNGDNGAADRIAFIAPSAGDGAHPDAVFYNTNSVQDASELNEDGYSTRIYHIKNPEDYQEAQEAGINHIAVNQGDSSTREDYAENGGF